MANTNRAPKSHNSPAEGNIRAPLPQCRAEPGLCLRIHSQAVFKPAAVFSGHEHTMDIQYQGLCFAVQGISWAPSLLSERHCHFLNEWYLESVSCAY